MVELGISLPSSSDDLSMIVELLTERGRREMHREKIAETDTHFIKLAEKLAELNRFGCPRGRKFVLDILIS